MVGNSEFGLYKDWLAESEKSGNTKAKNLRDVEKFLRFCEKKISLLTKQDVIDYKDYLIIHYKPASVNSYLISLNGFLSVLGQDTLRVKTVQIQRRNSLNDVLSEKEYFALLEKAKSRPNNRLYYLIRTLASSGIRVSELRYITTDMLQSGKTVVYCKTKMREIYIPQKLCQELEQYCKERHIEGIIFHGRRADRLIDKARIWREMKQLAREANVPEEKVHCHNFRHFFAKTFLAQYHDIVDLADILGHNSIETTLIYTRTSNQEKQARINALNL
jgi:site-specific recombinase XerD